MSFVEFNSGGSFGAFGVLTGQEIAVGTIGGFILPLVFERPLSASSTEVVLALPIPVGAVVTRAVGRVSGSAPGPTTVGGIATVRAASGDPTTSSTSMIIDFGTLRSVSSVQFAGTVSDVVPWVGTKFAGELDFQQSFGFVDFTEVQTERLLVSLSAAVSPATFAAEAGVTTTTPPADLELVVGATRAWFRAGPVPAGFSEDVDITTALQAVVDAGGAPDADGNLLVPLVLRARVPGRLGLELAESLRYLRTLTVDFPGPTTTVRFAEEGRQDLVLPLPEGSAEWTINRVVANAVAEDPGPLRVLPPVGPAQSADVVLLLDADRRLVAKLAPGPLDRLADVAGIRVRLQPDAGGIEIGGALHGGTALEPGDALPDATFTPVSLPAGPAPAWVTLALARPIEPPVDEVLWASLAVTRGSAVLDLADPTSTPPDELATLRRIAPNGIARTPSSVTKFRANPGDTAVAVRTDALSLRVVGAPPDEAPIAVIELDLAGGATDRASAGVDSIAISPNPPGPRSPLALQITATAGTTLTVGPVVVAYTEPGGSS